MAVVEHDFESIAKPNHDFGHMSQAYDRGAIYTKKLVSGKLFFKCIQGMVEQIGGIPSIKAHAAIFYFNADNIIKIDEFETIPCRDGDFIGKGSPDLLYDVGTT